MNNHTTRRTAGIARSSAALGAAVLVLGSLALGACSKTDPSASSPVPAAQVQHQVTGATTDGDTVDLVDAAFQATGAAQTEQTTPGTGAGTAGKPGRQGLRARMLRALHGTWVTEGKAGPVTHQAVRGDVTAVSATSITVKAKDGFSLTFSVAGDTKVRARTTGKGTASTIGAVKVGSKALVVGLGATNPTARVVVFKVTTSSPGASPSPSASS
ncbi:hypothetical protein GCM10009817_35540 [Terrabacter lapilli]|uniref:DUF5666 domain-containing protein n=1 Tax=Terrabacter lapilli TaxID=436231 RepID=A0ABN2SQ26_9MICO